MGSINNRDDLLSPLAQLLCLSPTLEINELVHKIQGQGRQVVHLGFGEATFPIQEDVLRAYRTSSQKASYLPVAGLPKLREVSPTGHELYNPRYQNTDLLQNRQLQIFNHVDWEPKSVPTRWW